MRPSTESPTLDERATTSETTSLTPSFALVLLPRGFVLRPRPPWPGARRSDRLERASRALDHLAHAYDRAWRELAREMLHLRVIPRDGALDGLSLAYVDGRCACEVWDYRGRTPAGVPDVETVTLRRRTAKEKLGFSFEQTATGVVVTKVFPNLPAGQSGRIDVDDELLSVNGAPCATLPETLRLLQAAGAGDVAVEVRHPPHDPTGNKVEVVRRSTPTAKLGVTLGTTASSHVVVDKVFAGFPAAHLVVGDRVLAINGNPVNDVKGAMKLLAAAGTEVALTLRAPRHAAVIAVAKPTADTRLGIDLSFDPSTGACSVSNLHAGFAAAASCLMVGDELIGVNGERVLNYDQTIYALRSAAAGEVRLRIIRRGGCAG